MPDRPANDSAVEDSSGAVFRIFLFCSVIGLTEGTDGLIAWISLDAFLSRDDCIGWVTMVPTRSKTITTGMPTKTEHMITRGVMWGCCFINAITLPQFAKIGMRGMEQRNRSELLL